jgi:RNase adapter protein RapZ
VMDFLRKSPATGEFLERTGGLLEFLVPQYVAEGKSYLTIGVGCTGGRHRSVAITEALRRTLSRVDGARLRVRHRDIEME